MNPRERSVIRDAYIVIREVVNDERSDWRDSLTSVSNGLDDLLVGGSELRKTLYEICDEDSGESFLIKATCEEEAWNWLSVSEATSLASLHSQYKIREAVYHEV